MWNRDGAPRTDIPSAPLAQPQASTNPPAPASGSAGSADERRVVAWVGKSVVFRGDLISSEDMTIDGRVEGSVEVRNHHLTIGPNANIEADIAARLVTVFGKVAGSLTAEERVEIRQGATVEADLTCQTLSIQEGAFFCGKVSMAGRQQPKADAKAEKTEKAEKVEKAAEKPAAAQSSQK
jgi:cytoskeletal protein CcmA (bactofilin family)